MGKPCKSGSKVKLWLIVVIVVASIAGLLILSFIFAYFYDRRNMKKEKGLDTASNGRNSSSTMKVYPNENLWDNGVTLSSSITEELFYKVTAKGNTFYDSNDVNNKLVFFDGSNFGLEELLRASAELMTKENFGTVYREIAENGSVVVVKRLREFCKPREKQFDDYTLFLGKLSHQNILPLKGYFGKEEKLLLYDFMHNGTLHAIN